MKQKEIETKQKESAKMEYRHAQRDNYEDFAGGRVLYNIVGATNFPVRLINEIYGRCLEYSGKKADICLFDCCCGSGYSLTVLGFLNQQTISKIIASDIDEKMLEIAKANLSLLSVNGIKRRIEEIRSLYQKYKKESHLQAEKSAVKLMNLIQKEIEVQIFKANVFQDIPIDIKPDIIITDVPYCDLVDWQGGTDDISCLLESLAKICSNETVIAICMNKKQKIITTKFRRMEKQIIGKRKFEIYRLA